MPDDAAGVRFTALDTAEMLDENRLPDFYAYPDAPRSCWVHTPMRRGHLLTDEAGYLYTRYVRSR